MYLTLVQFTIHKSEFEITRVFVVEDDLTCRI